MTEEKTWANISRFQTYLFNSGDNFKSYEMLGSHKVKIDGVDGWRFAVWAPKAVNVRVVGDFNGWNGYDKMLERIETSGVWYGFFTDIAAVRRILTEPRDVEFVDLAYLLANVIFLAEILRFFQFSVGERAWTCGNGHSFVTECFLCSFQQKCGVHSTGKSYGYTSQRTEDFLEFSVFFFKCDVIYCWHMFCHLVICKILFLPDPNL